MITEDYVSSETAKLLKEKGFDWECEYFYDYYEEDDKCVVCSIGGNCNSKEYPTYYSMPTLQMAMKWLREVHKIYIDISPTYSEVEKTIHFIWQIFDSNYDGIGDCEIFYGKYETACEESIKYCLENLI